MSQQYVIWSNRHKCWWGPNSAGYSRSISDAGKYERQEALKICKRACGGREFNENPTEILILLKDARIFWPDDQEDWRIARAKAKRQNSEEEDF